MASTPAHGSPPDDAPYAPLPGRALNLNGRAGRVAVHVDGHGPPLLLVHSVNAAASAAEVRPLYMHYRATRTVWALDLPGYGLSERSDRAYTPRLMTDALLDVAEHIRQSAPPQDTPASAIDALAVSLSCEFLARAACEAPAHWRSLALVSPTGFNGERSWHAPPGTTRAVRGLLPALQGPGGLWGRALFRGLTRPSVVRYFLRRTFGARDIDEGLWRDAVRTAQHEGAHHAPLHFLSAGLFSADVHTLYEALTQPVWMSHGVRGDFTDYRGKARLKEHANWRFSVFPCGAMPYFEDLTAFVQAYDAFLAQS